MVTLKRGWSLKSVKSYYLSCESHLGSVQKRSFYSHKLSRRSSATRKLCEEDQKFLVQYHEIWGPCTTLIMFFDHLEVFSVLETSFFELFSVQRIFPVILKTFGSPQTIKQYSYGACLGFKLKRAISADLSTKLGERALKQNQSFRFFRCNESTTRPFALILCQNAVLVCAKCSQNMKPNGHLTAELQCIKGWDPLEPRDYPTLGGEVKRTLYKITKK